MQGEVGESEEAMLFPTTVGEKLRAARQAQGLELSDIAQRTRIPQRHLEAIEGSNFSGLPSITYAMGFAKAYARAVGVDEVAIARELRGQLGGAFERPAPAPVYQASDPARLPPRGLAVFGLIVALLVLAGVGLWYGTSWFRGEPETPDALAPLTDPSPAPLAAPTEAAPAPDTGQVTLTATGEVWMRIYDATDKVLFEKTMLAGETYDVPSDADRPMINIGRPDLVTVTVNGSAVAPLGTAERAIKDVGVSAAALQARGASSGAPPLPVMPDGNGLGVP